MYRARAGICRAFSGICEPRKEESMQEYIEPEQECVEHFQEYVEPRKKKPIQEYKEPEQEYVEPGQEGSHFLLMQLYIKIKKPMV
jgi:hypothetical protein